MLNINNNKSKKYRIPLLLIPISLGGIFLFQYLTFIPEYSSAESISTITPAKTLADLEYMDEVTPEICGSTPLADTEGNHQYPLKDPRDGQSYTVAKLKDGNCWMTQNINVAIDLDDQIDQGIYSIGKGSRACTQLAGWDLPSQAQYKTLMSGISNSATLITSPYSFQYGNYWTSTGNFHFAQPHYIAFQLTSNTINTDYSMVSSSKLHVRCITSGTTVTTPPTSINNPNISVSVPNILTLEVTDSATMEDIVANTTNTQEFTATVTSNANYSLNLNATNTDAYATSLVNIKDNHMIGHIDSISSPSTTLNPNQWGIKACSSLLASCDGALFQPLPTKDQTPDSINPFFTSTPGSHTHLFQIGINPSSSLPSGTYSTTITVTASQK